MIRRLSPFLCFLVLGCRTTPQTLQTRELAEISAATGAVASTLIHDPNAPSVELGPGEEYVAAELDRGNPTPEYPPELVALRVPPHKVVTRITFSERGRPLTIVPSPLGGSTESAHLAAFEDAVGRALQMWRCYPPRIRKFRPGPDSDGDGKPDFRIMADQKILKTFFDVAFTFEVIDGQPVVRQSK